MFTSTAMKRSVHLSIVAALAGATPVAAATVIWSAPVDSSGLASDVITRGTLVDAFTFGATTTVNGVTFVNTGFGVPNTGSYGVLSNFGVFGPGWDPEYRTLVASTAYLVNPTYVELIYPSLPAGEYIAQLFMPQWDANWATAFSINGVRSAPVQAGGHLQVQNIFAPRPRPQWVTVRYASDGISDLVIRSESLTTYQLIAAMQLRAVPEPATWALLITGFGLSGVALRRRRSAASA